MKRTKKMLALVLALMMAFTTLVMPAMAADEDEGIMPRKPVYECATCGGYAEMSTSERTGSIKVDSCTKKPDKEHYHDAIIVTKTITCENGHSSSGETVYVGACRG